MPALIVSGLALLLVLWLLGEPFLRAHRRQRLRARPFPPAWHGILKQRVPLVRALPASLQRQLQQHIQVFVAEKAFIGCQGLIISEEMRVTIAAHACLLILQRPRGYYPALHQIMVYPDCFVVRHEHTDDSGVTHFARQVLVGESCAQGQVVLSWPDARDGAAIADDGYNVLIHEFAHQLDQETGIANGAPQLTQRDHDTRWSQVLGAEFKALQMRAAHRQPCLFDDYGATDPAEFFAVISEVFFEQPDRMARKHPALYAELALFYDLDPQRWGRAMTVNIAP